MTRNLRRPNRRDGAQDPRPDPVQDTRTKHPVRVLGGGLHDGAEDGPCGADGDGAYATEFVAEPAPDEGADEGTGEVVDRDLWEVSAASRDFV